MSNHLISTTYKRDLRTPMRKAVLALFADKASDDGSGIYASKQTMADELCCSKQALLDTIKAFIAEGLLVEMGQRRSPNGFTVEYGIVVEALEALPLVKCHADRAARQSTTLTGQPAGPVKKVDRSSRLTAPVKQVDPNPPEPTSPKTTSSPKKKRAAAPPAFVPPSDIPEDAWDGFEEMRRRIGKPMTQRARDLAVTTLRQLAESGHPPGEVLNASTLNNWSGLYPLKDNGHGQRNHQDRPSAAERSGRRYRDPLLDRYAGGVDPGMG